MSTSTHSSAIAAEPRYEGSHDCSGKSAAGRTPQVLWPLAALSLSMLLASLGISIANVALPVLTQVFHCSFQAVQWVVLAYLLANTALIVPAGRLGDHLGRRRLLLAGLGLYTLAALLCALAQDFAWLIAARAVQGAGAAIMMAHTLALAGATMPKEKTGSAMGLLGAMSAIGTALGPGLGGTLIDAFGWRAIFTITAPLGLAALLLASRCLPPDPCRAADAKTAIDFPGALVLALTLCAYALSMTIGRGQWGWLNAALLAAAAAGAVFFGWIESKTATPLVHLELLRAHTLRAGFLSNTIVSAVVMTTLVAGPFYLAQTLGLDATQVGLVMSCGPIVSALSGILSGKLVDRLGAARLVRTGLGIMCTGTLGLTFLPGGLGVPGYVLPLMILTSGYALFQVANNTHVMGSTQPSQQGLVSALLNLSRNLGLVTGASLMGAVFVLGSGGAHTGSAAALGLCFTFGVASVLVAGALYVTWHGSQRGGN